MSESNTIGQLLDYMEANSFHTPDASVCDCFSCTAYSMIINMSKRMDNGGTTVRIY